MRESFAATTIRNSSFPSHSVRFSSNVPSGGNSASQLAKIIRSRKSEEEERVEESSSSFYDRFYFILFYFLRCGISRSSFRPAVYGSCALISNIFAMTILRSAPLDTREERAHKNARTLSSTHNDALGNKKRRKRGGTEQCTSKEMFQGCANC